MDKALEIGRLAVGAALLLGACGAVGPEQTVCCDPTPDDATCSVECPCRRDLSNEDLNRRIENLERDAARIHFAPAVEACNKKLAKLKAAGEGTERWSCCPAEWECDAQGVLRHNEDDFCTCWGGTVMPRVVQ